MDARVGPLAWFLAGAVSGFSFLAMASIGVFTLVPSILFGLVLFGLRVPGSSLYPTGAGTVVALLWGLHISSGDTPDDELWPIAVGAVTAVLGVVVFLTKRRTDTDPAEDPSVRNLV